MSANQIIDEKTKMLIKDRVASYLKEKEAMSDDDLFQAIKPYEDLNEFYTNKEKKDEKLKEIIAQARQSIKDEKQQAEQKQWQVIKCDVMKQLNIVTRNEQFAMTQALHKYDNFELVSSVNKERKKIIEIINGSISRGKTNSEIFSEINNKYPGYETIIHHMIYAQKTEMNRLKFKHEPAVDRTFVFQDIQKIVQQWPDAQSISLAEFLNNAKDALKKGDFVEAELNLNCHRDLQRGIVSRYITQDKNGTPLNMPVYLADARHVLKESEQKDTFENWASMGLSYFHIAVRMIENEIARLQKENPTQNRDINKKIDKLEKEIAVINNAAVHFLDEISTLMNNSDFTTRADKRHAAEIYESHAMSKVLIPHVSDVLGWKKAKALQAEMVKLKDFGNLDRKPFASVTITKEAENSDNFTLRSDVPVYQLTKKQQAEMQAIIASIDENSSNLPAWYREQTDREAKKLIRFYAPAILQGRDLPTQMLQFIPYLRNAKQIQYHHVSKNDSEQLSFEKYFDNYGTGNIGNEMVGVSQNASIQGVQEALDQFQEATGAQKTYLQSLVTTSRFRLGIMKAWAFITGGKTPGDEVIIDTNDRMAVTAKNTDNEKPSVLYQFAEKWLPSSLVQFFSKKSISQNNPENIENADENSSLIEKTKPEFVYGNLAINDTRRINNPDMTAIHAVSEQATQYLAHAKNNTSMTSDMKKIIIQLRWVQEEYNDLNRFVFIDDDNRNLQMAAKLEQMVSLMRIYREKCVERNFEHIKIPPLVASSSFCKSAKDRAGMVKIAVGEAGARQKAVSELLNQLDEVYQHSISEKSEKQPILTQIYNATERQRAYKIEALRAIWYQIKGGHDGRLAANQSAGCEGIKNGEGIIPKWIVNELADVGITLEGEDLRALLERREAHFNSKIGKLKDSNAFVQKVLKIQQFEMRASDSSQLNESLHVDSHASPVDYFAKEDEHKRVLTAEEQRQIEIVEKDLCSKALEMAEKPEEHHSFRQSASAA